MHSIISQWLEIFFFLSVLLKVDLSETTFPQNGHYNSRYPKVRPFFENGTRLWSKDKAEPILLSDSLKQLTYKGPCFPTCFPHFWTGRVTYLETSTEMYQKKKKTKNQKRKASVHSTRWRALEGKERGAHNQEPHIGEKVESTKSFLGTGTWFAHRPRVAGVHLLWALFRCHEMSKAQK